jgi:protein TonB
MQGWEELLYENRNKSYGSYLLRKKYIKYLLFGFLSSLFALSIPLSIIFYNSHKIEVVTEMPLSIAVELNQIPDELRLAPPPPQQNPNQEVEEPPVVVDSVKEEQKKTVKKEEGPPVDSAFLLSEKLKASGNGINEAGDSSFYVYADEMPQFYGGEIELRRFMQKNFNYPESSRKAKKHGKVIVQFIISKTGDVQDISIQASVDPELDKEVMRVVALLPKWKPGKQGGKPVPVMFRIPINLKL